MNDMPTYVDLFAGCGGLSLGLEKSGWELKVAVEKSAMAGETFYYNLIDPDGVDSKWSNEFPALPVETQLEKRLVVGTVEQVLKNPNIMDELERAKIDLLAGGPPCQGFSLAGRRNQDDVRNALAWDFLDFAHKVLPKFIVMENVLGMNAKFSKSNSNSVYEDLATAIRYLGDKTLKTERYLVQRIHANAMHFGAAQNRPRLLIVACRLDVAAELSVTVTNDIWKSDFLQNISADDIPKLAPIPTVFNKAQTVQSALSDFLGFGDSGYSRALKDAKEWSFLKAPKELSNTNVRRHGERSKQKFAMYQLISRFKLDPVLMRGVDSPKAIEFRNKALEEAETLLDFPLKDAGSLTGLSKVAFFHLLEGLKTRKHSQRVLDLTKPAPTVVTAADDLVHPLEERVLSVRELARFQGFPDSFQFRSKETTGGLKRRTEVPQYSQVGNAVSPFLSLAIGKRLLSLR